MTETWRRLIEASPPSKTRDLLEQLYSHNITVAEFKKLCVENKINYEYIEHCCCCAGCHESKDHICPDYEQRDLKCQLIEERYCGICLKNAKIGIPMTNEKHKETSVFWVCDEHENDPLLHSLVKPEDLNRNRRYDINGYVIVRPE